MESPCCVSVIDRHVVLVRLRRHFYEFKTRWLLEGAWRPTDKFCEAVVLYRQPDHLASRLLTFEPRSACYQTSNSSVLEERWRVGLLDEQL